MRPVLYVGSAWSASWSICGWMACRLGGLDVEMRTLHLDVPTTKIELKSVSPSGRVPVLVVEGQPIWDSLAIVEFAWERNPRSPIWPTDGRARAYARSIAAEVHAQFEEVRAALPMNLVKRWPIARSLPSAESHFNRAGIKGGEQGVRNGLRRMEEAWRDCRVIYGAGGSFLFGQDFTFADALFAPMCSRYRTYGLQAEADATAYIEAVLAHPLMREWAELAERDAQEFGREVAAAYP